MNRDAPRKPVLVACLHGTSDQPARKVVGALVADVRALLGVEVVSAFIGVEEPRLAQALASISPGDGLSAVVVPVLLGAGFHVYHDVTRAVAVRPDAVVTSALGPDPRLAEIALDRLQESGLSSGATVVFAIAGSSDPRSQADTVLAFTAVRDAWPGRVVLGNAAAIEPTVAGAVAAARASGAEEVGILSFLLAPGLFHQKLRGVGADAVTAPLAPDRRLVEIVAERYRDAIAAWR